MRIEDFEFGRIRIDGVDYEYDLVIEAGRVRKRKKGPSKPRREEFGHTPLTASEKVPWQAEWLWIGTGVNPNPAKSCRWREGPFKGLVASADSGDVAEAECSRPVGGDQTPGNIEPLEARCLD